MKLLFRRMKNNFNWILPLILAAGLIIYGLIYVEGLRKEMRHWQNEAAKLRGQVEVAKDVYESQAFVFDELKIENKKLKERLEKTGRNAKYYTNLSLRYKTSLDSIMSIPVDSTMIADEDSSNSSFIPTIEDRSFSLTLPGELTLEGYFQPYKPYGLYISNLDLLMNLSIVVSQYSDGTWWYDIDTGSPRLKPEQVKVQIKPRPTPWEFFTGGSLYIDGAAPIGIGAIGGIKKGYYGGYISINLISGKSPLIELGIVKYFEL